MSLKDLFLEENKAEKSLLNVSAKKLVDSKDLESESFLQAYSKDKRRVIPDLDLSDPKNFARFGRAELYYEKAFEHVQNYYPYDGSDYEKLAFQNSGSLLDMYILDKQYPKSTGFVSFGKDIAYDGSATVPFGLKNTTAPEFILFKGGPNKGLEGYSIKEDISISKANVYDADKSRTSNLSLDMSLGSTVEFWMKKTTFAGSSGEREIVFDLWNSASISDTGAHGTYARLNVSCIQSSTNVITLFHQSGNLSHTANLDTGLATVADGLWHHYSITTVNNGSDLFVDLFVDGKHKDQSKGTGKATNPVVGAMHGTLGAAVFQMAGDSAGGIGYGKLSGSIDDFRYWKKARTSKEVQRNWKNHVGGGTNTDDANTTLGVYYKFNEGITATSSIDQTILDYSGRISNGQFTGYNASFSRSTGSAFEESGNGIFENKDPIIYDFHPDVVAELESLKALGRAHDSQNTSLLEHMIPSWIIEEEEDKDTTVTKDLLQILAFYFDELSMQMTAHKDLKNVNYVSGSITGSYTRPLPYSRRLLNSHGFIAPEIFTQAEHFENLQNKNDDFAFSGSLDEVKNIIYGNIYNNLTAIQKSKGTRRSIQNLLHCVGIDEDIFKINLYSSGEQLRLENNFKTRAVKTRSLDFAGKTERSVGTAYQYTDGNNSDSQNFITGTFDDAKETSLGYSIETEVIFPIQSRPGSLVAEQREFVEITSSIFGQHTAENNLIGKGNDLTFGDDPADSKDHSNVSIFAIRPEVHSKDAKIFVTGSEIGFFETETIKDLYNGGKYNIVFRISPGKPDFINSLSGAGSPPGHGGMTASILVTSTNYDKITTLVTATKELTFTKAANFLKHNKRVYVGAHYDNFTSSLLQKSDVKVNSCRVWLHDLDQETIIAHNRDLLTFGATRPNKKINTTVTSLQGVEVPLDRTLLLHWNFSVNTGSNASGQMLILDESSGSLPNTSSYGWVGTISNKFHTARADFFPSNDSNIVDIDYISSARQQLPEVIDSDDMVQILSGSDDVIFTKESRPIDYIYAIEKSYYQSISEEILNFFATIEDFHNLIGQPVNRYRQDYKELGKLRQLLFQKFEDIADVEKYVNYYKWFDSSIVKMIENLIPASARFTKGVSNVIESHVLERNKYWNKFPTLEMRHDPPEGTIKGREELQYRWQFGHAPPPTSQATATFIGISGLASNYSSRKFTLQSTDGTTKTYRFHNSSSPATGELSGDEVIINVRGIAGTANIIAQLVAAVESSNGHNGKINTAISTTTVTNDTVTFTQTVAGDAGNTAITLTLFNASHQTFNGGATNTSFSGGESPGQNQNCLWHSERAEKTTPSLATSNASVDSDRQTIMEAIVTDVSGSGKQLVKYNADGTRTKYQAFRYANRSLLRHQDLVTDHLNHPNRRNRPHENKKYLYWRQAAKFTPPESQTSSSLVITGSSIHLDIPSMDGRTDCLDQDDLPTASFQNKFKYKFTTQHSVNDVLVEDTLFKGRITFPFSIYSGSGHSTAIPGTYAKQLSTFKTDIEINNLHHDQVHPSFRDAPLQSPFTEHHVGGNFYRHVAINSASAGRIGGTGSAGTNTPALSEGLHSSGSRPEGWALEVNANNIKLMSAAEFYDKSTPRAGGFVFRDQAAKRPLNIKNILVTTASNQAALGNYSKGYQIFQSSNRKTNDLWFRSGSDGTGGFTFNELQSPFLSGNYDYELPIRTRNEHIFVERFSAPGGAEVMSRGFLDPESEQFSLYNSLNNRNLNLRRALQGRSGSLLSNHATVGGYDSYFGSPTASFHKVYRNTQHTFKKVPVVVSIQFPQGLTDASRLESFVLTLTSSNGVARAYKFEDGTGGVTGTDQGSNVITVQLSGKTSLSAMTTELKAAINNGNGHGADGVRLTVVLTTINILNDTVIVAQTTEPTSTPGDYINSFGIVHADDPEDSAGKPTVNGVDPTTTTAAFMANENIYDILPHGVVLPTITVPVESFDNDHKQHAIPVSERQTSWITASLKDHALGSSAPLGYQQPDNKPYASGTFTFLSQSSLDVTSTKVQHPPLNFAGLNILTNDPITASTNTLGFPLNTNVQQYHTALAHPRSNDFLGVTSRFIVNPGRMLLKQNFDGETLNNVGNGLYAGRGALNHVNGASTGSATLNALLLRRNGPGGYSSWKQTRTGQHPVARFNRRHNIMTTLTSSLHGEPLTPDLARNKDQDYLLGKYENSVENIERTITEGLRILNEAPVTINRPFIETIKADTGGGATATTKISYSHVNNAQYFNTHYYNKNLLSKKQMSQKTPAYNNMIDIQNGNAPFGEISSATFNTQAIEYSEVFFPKKTFSFLSGTRGREAFSIGYWRNDRFERAIPATFFTNSMGMTLAASGSTDDAGAAEGVLTEGLTSGYGLDAAATLSIASPNSSIWPLDASLAGTDSGNAVIGADGAQFCDTTAFRSKLMNFVANTSTTFNKRRLIRLRPVASTALRSNNAGWALPECSDSGELQAAYQIYHMGEIDSLDGSGAHARALLNSPSSSVRLGQLINRKVLSGSATDATKIFLAGDTEYQCADQAVERNVLGGSLGGPEIKGPFYESYEDYSLDLRKLGKGFSIVPEFRISERIGYYVLSQSSEFGSTLTPNSVAFLDLTGSGIPESTTSTSGIQNFIAGFAYPEHSGELEVTNMDFINRYSTSEFLKMFEVISKDYGETDLGSTYFGQGEEPEANRRAPSRITLKCKALMKFLPYEGFYPMQRAMQLGTMFSASYGDRVALIGDQKHARTLFNPLFAPGIMYNSLKSGIACDYPIFTAPAIENPTTAQKGQGILRHGFRTTDHDGGALGDNSGSFKTSGSFDFRLPFETMLNPDKFLVNRNIIDQEPHPSASLNSTASLSMAGNKNPTYRLASHNFFSEIVNFYLENGLTTISGLPDNKSVNFSGEIAVAEDIGAAAASVSGDERSFIVDSFRDETTNELKQKEYRMRVVLRNTNTFRTPGEYAAIVTGSLPFDLNHTDGRDGIQGVSGSQESGYTKIFTFTTDPFRDPSVVVYERTGSSPFRFVLPKPTFAGMPVDPGGASPNPNLRSQNYVRGSSYGPPHSYTAGGDSGFISPSINEALGTMPNYSPYTPPYFNGLAYTEIIFRPEEGRGGYYSLEDILGGDFTFVDRRLTEVFNLYPESSDRLGVGNSSFLTTASWISTQDQEQSMKVSNCVDMMTAREVPALVSMLGPGNTPSFSENFGAGVSGMSVQFNTKFECPIFDYSNVGVNSPPRGRSGLVRGTWHQYGDDINLSIKLPGGVNTAAVDLKEGVVLEIQDIPDTEKLTPAETGSLATLLGIPPGPERSKRIGKIKKKLTVEEAIVAIPFRINEAGNERFFRINPHVLVRLARMYNGQDEYTGKLQDFDGFNPAIQGVGAPTNAAGDGITMAFNLDAVEGLYESIVRATPGNEDKTVDALKRVEPHESLKQLVETMRRFVLPPKFSWLDHRIPIREALSAAVYKHMQDVAQDSYFTSKYPVGAEPFGTDDHASAGARRRTSLSYESDPSIGPIVMYIFPFSHTFTKTDMKNMWHNLPPSTSPVIQKSEFEISHDLLPLDLFGIDDASRQTAEEKLLNGHRTTFSKDVQWMVFKVKQRAATDYSNFKGGGFNERLYEDNAFNPEIEGMPTSSPRFSYNWPYDYFSLIELIQLEETLHFER